MSDESPPLRLKPRLKLEAEPAGTDPAATPPANAVPTPSTEPPPAEQPSPKFQLRPKSTPPPAEPTTASVGAAPDTVPPAADRPRLKPRLVGDVPASIPAEPAPESLFVPPPSPPAAVVPAPEPPAVIPPPPVAEQAPVPPPPERGDGEAPKFRLKPKSTEPVPAILPVVAVPPSEAGPPPLPAAVPSPASPAAPKIPHVRAPDGVMPDVAPPRPPVQRRAFKLGVVGAAAVMVVLLGVGAFYAKQLLETDAPAPAPAAPRPTVAAPAAAPANESGTARSLPGKLIEKAENAVATRRGYEQDRVDALVAGKDPPEKRALDTPPPAVFVGGRKEPEPPPTTRAAVTTTIAPGVTATTSELITMPEASPAFRAWVADARISSVLAGASPRAGINGRVVRAGQVVDETLGVVFERVDEERRLVIFKDRTGVTVAKKY